MKYKLIKIKTSNDLFIKSADLINNNFQDKESNFFSIALSGGRTPGAIFDYLAENYISQINWDYIHIFWTDERCVPPDYNESNYLLAKEHLIDKVGAKNVYRMKGELDPHKAALEYEKTLKNVFNLKEGEFPHFDLMLMGIGEDGHTASLFPDTEGLYERKKLVVANYIPKFDSFRISLTMPVINNAKKLLFIASGVHKHEMFSFATRNDQSEKIIPLDYIDPVDGEIIWIVDNEAYTGIN